MMSRRRGGGHPGSESGGSHIACSRKGAPGQTPGRLCAPATAAPRETRVNAFTSANIDKSPTAETRCWMQLVDDGSHLAALSGRFNRRSTTGHKGEQMYFGFFSASWINQIERFFGLLTENQIRRGVFQSVDDLKQAITRSSMPQPSSQAIPMDQIS